MNMNSGFMTAWDITNNTTGAIAGFVVRRPDLKKMQFYAIKGVEFDPITLTNSEVFREFELEVFDMPEGVQGATQLLDFLIAQVEENNRRQADMVEVFEQIAKAIGIGAKAYVGQFDQEKYRDCFAILPGTFSDDTTVRIYFDHVEGRELSQSEFFSDEKQRSVTFIPFPKELQAKGMEEKVKFLLSEIDAEVAIDGRGEITYSNKIDPTNN